MFVCSAYGSVPKNRSKAKEDYLEKTMTEMGIKADVYDAFGGVLDFSESSRMRFLDKKMLNMTAKGLEKDIDLKIEKNTKNDLRDWEQIRAFAEQFGKIVKD